MGFLIKNSFPPLGPLWTCYNTFRIFCLRNLPCSRRPVCQSNQWLSWLQIFNFEICITIINFINLFPLHIFLYDKCCFLTGIAGYHNLLVSKKYLSPSMPKPLRVTDNKNNISKIHNALYEVKNKKKEFIHLKLFQCCYKSNNFIFCK